jgi:hypothetical protein
VETADDVRTGIAGRGIPMKTLAVIFLMVISFGGATAQAQKRACVDPPVLLAEKCFKQSGARCDPMTGRWIGGNSQAYKACRSASGAEADAKGSRYRVISPIEAATTP